MLASFPFLLLFSFLPYYLSRSRNYFFNLVCNNTTSKYFLIKKNKVKIFLNNYCGNILIISHTRKEYNTFFVKLWITFKKEKTRNKSFRSEQLNSFLLIRKSFVLDFFVNYFHLKRVTAKLQHMCLCECDHPLQIKTIL